jgi:uncharacterized integral membrane protein
MNAPHRGTDAGTNWRAWGVGLLIALVLIVALQNSQEVHVDVLFLSINAPLIVILLITALVGAVIGYVAPLVLRHRREGRRTLEAGGKK